MKRLLYVAVIMSAVCLFVPSKSKAQAGPDEGEYMALCQDEQLKHAGPGYLGDIFFYCLTQYYADLAEGSIDDALDSMFDAFYGPYPDFRTGSTQEYILDPYGHGDDLPYGIYPD
jgi:hypothetical protein